TADGAAIVVPSRQPQPTAALELGEDRDGTRLQFTQRFIQRHLSRRLTSVDAIATLHGCDAVREVTWLLGIRVAEHGRAESPSGTPNLLEWSGTRLDQLREGPRKCQPTDQLPGRRWIGVGTRWFLAVEWPACWPPECWPTPSSR